jgi:hypothetical protein
MTTIDIRHRLLPSATHHGTNRQVNTGPVATLRRLSLLSPTPPPAVAAVAAAAGGMLCRPLIADSLAATAESPDRSPRYAPAPAPPMPTRAAGAPR